MGKPTNRVKVIQRRPRARPNPPEGIGLRFSTRRELGESMLPLYRDFAACWGFPGLEPTDLVTDMVTNLLHLADCLFHLDGYFVSGDEVLASAAFIYHEELRDLPALRAHEPTSRRADERAKWSTAGGSTLEP